MFYRIIDFFEFVGGTAVDLGKVGVAAVEEVVDRVVENPVKAAAVIGAGVATGGVGYLYAPTVGAWVSAAGFGVGGGTLTGAAASKAGLAFLGGGSLASGGAGVAGGTAVVTGTGSAVGVTASSLVPVSARKGPK